MSDNQVRQIFSRVEKIASNNGTQLVTLCVALSKLRIPEEVLHLEKKLDAYGESVDYVTVLKLIKQCYS